MKSILSYLSELEQNNNREWYHANKQRLKEATDEFEQLLQALIIRIGKTDESIIGLDPKTLTFKLVRDTRFSKDKSPYAAAFRAHIGPQGKLPIPVGHFILLAPGDRSIIGGGLFASMFAEATSMVRNAIASNGDEFERIIINKAFAEVFTVKGEALKKVPQGYDPAHPQAGYLKNKSWYIEYPVADAMLADTDQFLADAEDICKRMQPFNRFLNKALAGFSMPSR